MEGLLVLLIVFWIAKGIAGKGRRAARNVRREKAAPYKESPAAQRGMRAASIQEEAQRRQQERAAEAVRAQPEPKQITVEEAMNEGVSAYRPIQHRMIQASSPMDYEGSLGGGSTEGLDTCDPELEHGVRRQTAAEGVYADETGGEPLIDLSLRGMMQGIIINEILTRPAQRVRR